MTPATPARQVVDALRQAAAHDATRHLSLLQRHAEQQAGPAANQLLDTMVPGQRPHQRRIARVLHHWYIDTYLDTLRHNLHGGELRLGAADVDRHATIVAGHLGPTARRDSALTITALVWRKARHDAALAVQEIWDDLNAIAAGRPRQLVPAEALAGDPLRPELLRQWYRRVYLNHVRAELGLLTPLRLVSSGEAAAVSQAVTDGRPYRLVGADGVPLMTAQGTVTTEADRRLDAGEVGVVDAPLPTDKTRLQRRVASYWAAHHDPAARLDLALACFQLPPRWVAVLAGKEFRQLAHVHQLAVMQEYLRRTEPGDDKPARFVPAELAPGPSPDVAAAAMFNLRPAPPDHPPLPAAALALHGSPCVDSEVQEAYALAAAGFGRLDPRDLSPTLPPGSPRPPLQPSSPGPARRR